MAIEIGRVRNVIVSVLSTLATASLLWVGATLVDVRARTEVLEARLGVVEKWLERIEGKLDRALSR